MSDPILPGGEAGLREALAAVISDTLLNWLVVTPGTTYADNVVDAIVDIIVAEPLAQSQSDRTRLQQELAAVDLAFEGLEETDRARRIGHWIGLAAAETTRANAAEVKLIALANMYGEACGELQILRVLAHDVATEHDRQAAFCDIYEEAHQDAVDAVGLITRQRDAAEAAVRERDAEIERLKTKVDAALNDACRMQSILLMAGEMTAQERRTARAVALGLAWRVRAALTPDPQPATAEEAGDHA